MYVERSVDLHPFTDTAGISRKGLLGRHEGDGTTVYIFNIQFLDPLLDVTRNCFCPHSSSTSTRDSFLSHCSSLWTSPSLGHSFADLIC